MDIFLYNAKPNARFQQMRSDDAIGKVSFPRIKQKTDLMFPFLHQFIKFLIREQIFLLKAVVSQFRKT